MSDSEYSSSSCSSESSTSSEILNLNLKSETSHIMELLFQDIVYSLTKLKLPDNITKKNNFYVKITAKKITNRTTNISSDHDGQKQEIFNKNKNRDYKSCSQKLIGLVTSILFKNKSILFEMIDEWVTKDIMPLIPDLDHPSDPIKSNVQQSTSNTSLPSSQLNTSNSSNDLTSENIDSGISEVTKPSTLSKIFPNLGWRIDHSKIFDKSQIVIPKIRAFFAKIIKNYFTIDYDSLSTKCKKTTSSIRNNNGNSNTLLKVESIHSISKSNTDIKSPPNTPLKVPFEIKNWIIIASVHAIGVIIIESYNSKVLHKHRNYTFSMIRLVSVAMTDYISSNHLYFFKICGWKSLQYLNLDYRSKFQTQNQNESMRSRGIQKSRSRSSSRPKFSRSRTLNTNTQHNNIIQCSNNVPQTSQHLKNSINYKIKSNSQLNLAGLSDDELYSSSRSNRNRRQRFESDNSSSESLVEIGNSNKRKIGDFLPGAVIALGLGVAAILGARKI